MTRRIVTLAALVGIAGTIVLTVTDRAENDPGPSPVPSVPPLSTAVSADGDAEGGGSADGDADGDLGDQSVSVDSAEPAVSRLDGAVLAALRAAADQAAADGIEVRVTSGWRSRDYQQRLLAEAIQRYGSREEALRWVATPDTSAHVTGHAVDVGPTDAAYWMGEHGAQFGLCQTYANEIWHYEILTSPGGTCPTPRADGLS